jgi:3-isopropylmalate dehydrogenase
LNASILLLPGDGIGPEVVAAAEQVLRAVASRFNHNFTLTRATIGGAALKAGLAPLPDETLVAARAADAILLGAVGDPSYDTAHPAQRPEAALLKIRRELGLYANLRPARVWPGLESAGPLKPEILAGTDLVLFRELTGGLYYGEPRGYSAEGDSAHNTMRYSRGEIERIARRAFEAARLRRKRVTSVDKANVLEVSRLWRQVVTELARDYSDVTLDHMLVDTCAMKIAYAPSSFDVVVTENMFGDILSDEAGAVVGSLGLLPSASLGDGVGLYEPVHGSAPDIAGKGIANPIGTIASAAMLLRYSLKLEAEAAAVEQAIGEVLSAGRRTADLAQGGASIGTEAMTGEILAALGSTPSH